MLFDKVKFFIFPTISLYLILNYGFMLVRIPPEASGGIPVGEIVLILCLFTIGYPEVLRTLKSTIFLPALVIWITLGLMRAVLGVPEYGFWSLRDASHVIESLYIFVGIYFASTLTQSEQVFRWLILVSVFSVAYGLTFPFATQLASVSPTILGGAGEEIPLLFNYNNTSTLMTMAMCYLLIFRSKPKINSFRIFPAILLLLGFSQLMFQERTSYIQLLAVVGILFWYKRSLAQKILSAVLFLVCVVAVFPLFQLDIQGRLGQSISLEFLFHHFLAIAGIQTEGLEGSAGGVAQRMGWWIDIYGRLTEGWFSLLFGLGYGFPLIDFQLANEVAVREPHNSFISILARIGVIGGSAWLIFQISLFNTLRKSILFCRKNLLENELKCLIFSLIFFVQIIIFSLGEDAFEKPYNSIAYYFLWGVTLKYITQIYAHFEISQREKIE